MTQDDFSHRTPSPHEEFDQAMWDKRDAAPKPRAEAKPSPFAEAPGGHKTPGKTIKDL